MKIIALEEHFAPPEIIAAWQALSPGLQDFSLGQSTGGEVGRRLVDLADERLRCMDAAGVDVQVLSLTTPGVQSLEPGQAVPLARAANEFNGQHHKTRAGDLVRLPAGVPHCRCNLSAIPTHAMFWVAPGGRLRELFDALHNLCDPEQVVREAAQCEVHSLKLEDCAFDPLALKEGSQL